jgi:hypothetical protein
VNIAFDHRQAADDLFDGAVDCLKGILSAAFAALEFGDILRDCGDRSRSRRRAGAGIVAAAKLIDMREQVGKCALDGCQIAELRIGRLKPSDQLCDLFLKALEN